MCLSCDHYLERLLEGLIKACSGRNGPQWLSPIHAAVKPPPLPWRENKSHFLAFVDTLSPYCVFVNYRLSYDSCQYTERCNNNSQLLWLSHEPCDWIPSCALISPVYQQNGPTRKIKVPFAFTCAGSWSEAECQAAESGTAALPCAEKTEINDTVIGGGTSWLVCDICSNSVFNLPLFCKHILNRTVS